MQDEKLKALDTKIKELHQSPSLTKALENIEIIIQFFSKKKSNSSWQFLNIDKIIKNGSWFAKIPEFEDKRPAYKNDALIDENIDIKAYQLQKISKPKIAWLSSITQNFEDEDFDLGYNIGIDFVINKKANKIIVILSRRYKIRTLELHQKLSNTQKQIFQKWLDIPPFLEKGEMHQHLWDSFNIEPVNKEFFKEISKKFSSAVSFLKKANNTWTEEEQKYFINRLLSRILFTWFLNKKGLLNKAQQYLDIHKDQNSLDYYREKLEPLFFEVLNTPKDKRKSRIDTYTPYLNGGLFENINQEYNPSIKERDFDFPPDFFQELYDFLKLYNFTTDESTSDFQQIAIDPEMLGRIFENLLAEHQAETGEQARKAKGSFYTPREIVDFISHQSLKAYLEEELKSISEKKREEIIDKLLNKSDKEWIDQEKNYRQDLNTVKYDIFKALDEVKILDPACGSGAFPLGLLQLLLKTHQRLQASLDPMKKKLEIIQGNLYGVDIDPMATEISRLRIWLSLAVECEENPEKVKPLPNLDFKFVSANALFKLDETEQDLLSSKIRGDLRDNLTGVIPSYFQANSIKEKTLLKDKFYQYLNELKEFSDERYLAKGLTQLKSFKPFNPNNVIQFFDPQIIFALKENFDIIIGNPPYIQLQKNQGKLANLYKNESFKAFKSTGDIYCLFYERANQLLKDKGHCCFITSNKWMRAAYGEKLRNYFSKETSPKILIDLGPKVFDSATVDTNILLFQKGKADSPCRSLQLKESLKENTKDLKSLLEKESFSIENFSSNIWTILSPVEEKIREKIERIGTPLRDWSINIRRGILTGYNQAFIIDGKKKDELIANDPKSAEIIKPILRGRDIKRYHAEFKDQWVIASHNGYKDEQGERISAINIEKYPAIKEHLDQFKTQINKRQDQGETPYNLRNCAYHQEFKNEKIVYANMTQFLPFHYDKNFFYPNPKCFIITGKSLKFILSFCNSSLGSYWIKQNCPPLGKGWELKKVFFEKFPIPKISSTNQQPFIKLVDRILEITSRETYNAKDIPKEQKELEAEIDTLVYKLYELTQEEIDFIEKQSTK